MNKRSLLVVCLLIGLATSFPPFLLRGNREWGFLFNPPVSISEKYIIKRAVGQIDWSFLFAEYVLAIVIGLGFIRLMSTLENVNGTISV